MDTIPSFIPPFLQIRSWDFCFALWKGKASTSIFFSSRVFTLETLSVLFLSFPFLWPVPFIEAFWRSDTLVILGSFVFSRHHGGHWGFDASFFFTLFVAHFIPAFECAIPPIFCLSPPFFLQPLCRVEANERNIRPAVCFFLFNFLSIIFVAAEVLPS